MYMICHANASESGEIFTPWTSNSLGTRHGAKRYLLECVDGMTPGQAVAVLDRATARPGEWADGETDGAVYSVMFN